MKLRDLISKKTEARTKGKVLFFNPLKGFGKIQVEGLDDAVFIHRSNIQGEMTGLFQGEEVEFDLEESERGPQAKNLTRSVERFLGTVKRFGKGFGFIEVPDREMDLFIHWHDISGEGFRSLEEDEEVEFSIEEGDRGLAAKNLVRLDSRRPFEKFADLGDFDDQIAKLAGLAQKETWSYLKTSSRREHPILFNYVHHTFMRLEVEGKIAEASDSRRRQVACLNTGLVTDMQEEIFAYFERISRGDQDWALESFCKDSDRRMSVFAQRPDTANYFEDPYPLIYDTRIDLVLDYDHIINENLDRFPEVLQDNRFALRMAFEGTIKSAMKRVKRNYKTAIPHFHKGQVQLLLPLCLLKQNEADLALVVGKEGAVYKGYTVLTLDMAFNDARLLARPDREWLNP